MPEPVDAQQILDSVSLQLADTAIPWSAAQWRVFLTMPKEQQALEMQILADAAVPPAKSTWQEVLAILSVAATVIGVAASIAGGVSTIAGAVTAVQGIVK